MHKEMAGIPRPDFVCMFGEPPEISNADECITLIFNSWNEVHSGPLSMLLFYVTLLNTLLLGSIYHSTTGGGLLVPHSQRAYSRCKAILCRKAGLLVCVLRFWIW